MGLRFRYYLILPIIIILSVIIIISNQQKVTKQIDCRDCNVIFISIDTLRSDHLSLNGYFRKTSPNIDRFASENIIFKNFYSQITFTIPSHTSMFTSLYPFNHQVYNPKDVINTSMTLPQTLKLYNYTTVAFVGSAIKSGMVDAVFKKIFDWYDMGTGRRSFNKTIDLVKEWLEQNKNKKFFLFMHSYDVHSPEIHSQKTIFREYLSPNKTISEAINDYDNSIYYVDYLIGEFLDYLKSKNLYDKTIIIITSDHGEAFGEHGYFYHASGPPYAEQTHVPFIIHIPVFGSQINYQQAESVDIMPTILDVLNIIPPSQIDGMSMIPSILNVSKKVKNYTYREFPDIPGIIHAFRSDDWEIFLIGNKTELYDSRLDRYEKNDIYESNKQIGDFMKLEFEKWMQQNSKRQEQITIPSPTFIGYP